MSTIFSRIIAGQIPSYKIAENDRYFAFLDINPIAEGHTLVVPKHEIDYFFDLDNADLSGIMLFSKKNCNCTAFGRSLSAHRHCCCRPRGAACSCAFGAATNHPRSRFYKASFAIYATAVPIAN